MAYYKRTSFKSILNYFKEIKEDILAPLRKRKRFKKNPLPINNLIKALIIHALLNI